MVKKFKNFTKDVTVGDYVLLKDQYTDLDDYNLGFLSVKIIKQYTHLTEYCVEDVNDKSRFDIRKSDIVRFLTQTEIDKIELNNSTQKYNL